MLRVACFSCILSLSVSAGITDDSQLAVRPITEAEAVLAAYYQDHGLLSRGSPAIIFTAWPDGHMVWSNDRLKGGAPYRVGHVDPNKVAALLDRIEKDGFFADKKLNRSHLGPDSQFVTLFVKSGKKQVTMASWHEVYEDSGKLIADQNGISALEGRGRLEVLRKSPPDYLFFRLVWSETRGRMADLIPLVSSPSEGRPIMEAGILSWHDDATATRSNEAGNRLKK